MKKFLMLALAAHFLVTIPDHLIEDGARWHHYDKEERTQSKGQFVLDRSMPLLDRVIRIMTWGKLENFEASGITIEEVESFRELIDDETF